MSGIALFFMIMSWAIILGGVYITLSNLLKHQAK
ncbi:MAG TPA: MetS family NSS transporter small subunit [Thermoanaerobacter sp.]|nr:MetS family NSS transporter small subunit [Thermoanaerobacter sp. A7A]HHY80149.1 MetS family NSS transporter small subunit [Thermoanaerobacter sp.]